MPKNESAATVYNSREGYGEHMRRNIIINEQQAV